MWRFQKRGDEFPLGLNVSLVDVLKQLVFNIFNLLSRITYLTQRTKYNDLVQANKKAINVATYWLQSVAERSKKDKGAGTKT